MFFYLIKTSSKLIAAASLASLLSGLFAVLLISCINRAINAPDQPERLSLLLPFVFFSLGAMVCRMFANVAFQHLGECAHAKLRHRITDQLIAADYHAVERVGSARILSALAEHAGKVAEFLASMPSLLTNAMIVSGCLIFMGHLSLPLFAAALVVVVLGSAGYHLAHLYAIKHLASAAREQDRLYGLFRSLTDGAKELRINRSRREIFTQTVLAGSIEAVRRSRTAGMSVFTAVGSWGNFLAYAFIGFVLFAASGADAKVTTGYALICIFMVAPLEALLVNLPRANLARTAMNRIEALMNDLPSRELISAPVDRLALASVEMRDVTYLYRNDQSDDLFTLGPINLDFRPGELTFLVGGNGSGKTTLLKLLAGLYAPDRGAVWLNGENITHEKRDNYRQLFSVIFADFHLFDALLETDRPDLGSQCDRLLQRLHLDHAVEIRNGAFSRLSLSQGQRRRLALVLSYLEDRPFIVFDEWAADQDPVFKDVFYKELLPELRTQGKSVLVISHDDRYFHLADRVIWMEDGKISAVTAKPAASNLKQDYA